MITKPELYLQDPFAVQRDRGKSNRTLQFPASTQSLDDFRPLQLAYGDALFTDSTSKLFTVKFQELHQIF